MWIKTNKQILSMEMIKNIQRSMKLFQYIILLPPLINNQVKINKLWIPFRNSWNLYQNTVRKWKVYQINLYQKYKYKLEIHRLKKHLFIKHVPVYRSKLFKLSKLKEKVVYLLWNNLLNQKSKKSLINSKNSKLWRKEIKKMSSWILLV